MYIYILHMFALGEKWSRMPEKDCMFCTHKKKIENVISFIKALYFPDPMKNHNKSFESSFCVLFVSLSPSLLYYRDV